MPFVVQYSILDSHAAKFFRSPSEMFTVEGDGRYLEGLLIHRTLLHFLQNYTTLNFFMYICILIDDINVSS